MTRALAIILCMTMVISGCSGTSSTNHRKNESTVVKNTSSVLEKELSQINNSTVSFNDLDDPKLLNYVENNVYANLVQTLNSDKFFVENVEAIYISQEYIDELSYNSQSNIYFGYTLQELNQQFQGDRYVFALNENGETTVKKWKRFTMIQRRE